MTNNKRKKLPDKLAQERQWQKFTRVWMRTREERGELRANVVSVSWRPREEECTCDEQTAPLSFCTCSNPETAFRAHRAHM